MGADISKDLQQAVLAAIANKSPLNIIGGGSKSFCGRAASGTALSMAEHRGVVNYEPSELVITARAGTPLTEIETLLAQHGQMLAFEPPHFGAGGTLGGSIACGLSGPRRPYAGSARDFMLGVQIINGKGEILRFGGQVMKNVAGFDVSRLMTGSFGTLGILLEASLKVLPLPEMEETLLFEYDEEEAIRRMNAWAGQSLPLSGAFFESGQLHLRLSGSVAALRAARSRLGGENFSASADLWQRLRDQQHHFFQDETPLWRLSVAAATPPLNLPGECLLDWGGAQRWLKSDAPATTIRAALDKVGGHATLFRGGDRHGEVFHPLSPAMLAIHRRVKTAFDPHGIFNPGRMYSVLCPLSSVL